jgi:hypothetical protein
MKNGSLPTYRNWKNVTQKKPTSYDQTPSAMIHMPSVDSRSSGSIRPTITNEPIKPFQISPSATDRFTSSRPIDDRKQEMRALAMAVSASSDTYNPPNRYLKQRRTVRRKYALGKSKTQPKISVLISNRTIRNNIMTKTQAFKQVHIDEIKRFLVKKGFIRVGSSAPNDVLRKMYETASLMCGEIDNHNPDNLLYNYLHNTNESNA